MLAAGIWYFIQWLHYLALALWIGGITFISFAAPAAHGSMASRAVAGEIVGKILKRLNTIELFCFFILTTTIVLSFRFVRERPERLTWLLAVLLVMGLLASFYAFYLTPRMESLKEKIPTFDTLSAGNAAKIEFDRLHKIYVQLMTLNLALGLVLLYGSVVILK